MHNWWHYIKEDLYRLRWLLVFIGACLVAVLVAGVVLSAPAPPPREKLAGKWRLTFAGQWEMQWSGVWYTCAFAPNGASRITSTADGRSWEGRWTQEGQTLTVTEQVVGWYCPAKTWSVTLDDRLCGTTRGDHAQHADIPVEMRRMR